MTEEEIRRVYKILLPKYLKLQTFVCNDFESFSPTSTLPYPEEFMTFKSRIKTEESFVEKALRKDENGEQKYQNPFDQIDDFLGLTIVCYSNDDVKDTAHHLKYHFPLVPGTALDDFSRERNEKSFGHSAKKLEFEISNDFASSYPTFDTDLIGLRFEIQITTGTMFTWSKIQHDWLKWDKKFPKPEPLMRKIYAINALLELADNELSFIKNETEKLKTYNMTTLDINLDKLQNFCDEYFYDWGDGKYRESHEEHLVNLVDIIKRKNIPLSDIGSFFETYKNEIIQVDKEQWHILNPRHHRNSQYLIILTILQLMDPKYAHDSLKGTNKGPEIIELYNNWREKYLPPKS